MGVELYPEQSLLDGFGRDRHHDFTNSSTSSSSSSFHSGRGHRTVLSTSNSLQSDDAVFPARRHHHVASSHLPPQQPRRPSDKALLRKPPPPPAMRAFAQDGSFAFTDTTRPQSQLEPQHGGQRRKRVPRAPSAASTSSSSSSPQQRDLESATSVLEATRRMELARQRSHVSFGQRTINLDKTFRTAPGGRARVTLESPPHSPKRTGRAASASFMTPAQVIYAASTGSSSRVSTNSSSGSSGSGSNRSLSRQATLRAIAKGTRAGLSTATSSSLSDESFASTGSSTSSAVSSVLSSSPSGGNRSVAVELLAAKHSSKVYKASSSTSRTTTGECNHDHAATPTGSSTTSVATMASPIHAACRKGDYLVVKHVLSFYYGNECVNLVNSSCTCGMTPLQVASDNGHTAIAKLLLRRHANPNKRGGSSSQSKRKSRRHPTCLAIASAQNNVELAEMLLQYGASVDDDALALAASSGYDDLLRLLVNYRPKRSALSFDRPTQLFYKTTGASSTTTATTTTAPSSGELDASSINKAAALAVAQDHPECLAILLGDARATSSRTKVMACALDAAVQADYRLLRALARLYDARVLLEARDASACSLLHHAVRTESVKSVVLLLRLGADVHARDGGGITPLYIACARGHSAIVRLLVQSGAKCIAMGPNDETPLHIAAQENHLACVELLLAPSAIHYDTVAQAPPPPVDGMTRDRCTALHLACQRGNTQVAALLLAHGADVNALTVSDETPLLKATRMSQLQTVKLLLTHGATTRANEARRMKDEAAAGAVDEAMAAVAVPTSMTTTMTTDENRNDLNSSHGSSVDSRCGASMLSTTTTSRNDERIFIAKSNTHTSLKKWIRSVLKTDK